MIFTRSSFQVKRPETIAEIVRKAFKVAEMEKPGAVHIELLVDNGMCKINYYAELSKAAVGSIRERFAEEPDTTNITRLLGGMRGAVQQTAEEKIVIWGSAGRSRP